MFGKRSREFRDEIEVKTFFFLENTSISEQNRQIRDEILALGP